MNYTRAQRIKHLENMLNKARQLKPSGDITLESIQELIHVLENRLKLTKSNESLG